MVDNPATLMMMNFDPEIRKVLSELGVKYVEYDADNIRFIHKGYSFELKIKEIKNLVV